MAFREDKPVMGEYMHPIVDESAKNSDPWYRNYNQPPPMKHLVPRSYPLVDIRRLLLEPNYSPAKLLQSHGFGVVKHRSVFLGRLHEALDAQSFSKIYFAETAQLVKTTTGAKSVFIVGSVLRQGKSKPEEYKLPTKLGSVKDAVAQDSSDQNGQQAESKAPHKLSGQDKLNLAAPIRVPHMDFTPLGARQAIRLQSQEIVDAATNSGVIAFEDQLCSDIGVSALSEESNKVIAQLYNNNKQLGPHYAAYSIWRPLRTVQRDPITLSPRKESSLPKGDLIYWPYLNKIKGTQEISGDYLKEYAMLGLDDEKSRLNSNEYAKEETPKWYYVSRQESDEVLFIKLFDSASLGHDTEHASAPWHASPEIGDVEGDDPRESIDIRVIAFW